MGDTWDSRGLWLDVARRESAGLVTGLGSNISLTFNTAPSKIILRNTRFLVASSNLSFYGGLSLRHVTLQRLRGTDSGQSTGRPLWVRKIFKGWKIFVDGGGSVYERLQRPFKNDSFATRGFPTLFLLLFHVEHQHLEVVQESIIISINTKLHWTNLSTEVPR